jgi:hypothetical protein
MTSNLQDKLQHQQAFWHRENHDRPVIGFTGTYFASSAMRCIRRREGRISPEDIDVAAFLAHCEEEFAAWQDCTGDLFWTANALYPFRWLAAAVGAPVWIGGDSIWAEPFIEDYSDVAALTLAEDNAWLQKLWALTDALVSHAAGRFPVAANEFMSPLSAVADLRGNTQFAFDLYDHPGEVVQALNQFTAIWSGLVATQYPRLPAWHGGYTSAQRYLWAPGRIVEFSEDPAFLFSPRFHRTFILPSHRQVIRQVEYAYLHLHSTQLHTLDPLLALEELVAIELTPDYGASIADLIPTLVKIQAQKPLIVHAFFSVEEMRMIIERVPPEGLCVIGRAETPEEARRLQEALLGSP